MSFSVIPKNISLSHLLDTQYTKWCSNDFIEKFHQEFKRFIRDCSNKFSGYVKNITKVFETLYPMFYRKEIAIHLDPNSTSKKNY